MLIYSLDFFEIVPVIGIKKLYKMAILDFEEKFYHVQNGVNAYFFA